MFIDVYSNKTSIPPEIVLVSVSVHVNDPAPSSNDSLDDNNQDATSSSTASQDNSSIVFIGGAVVGLLLLLYMIYLFYTKIWTGMWKVVDDENPLILRGHVHHDHDRVRLSHV